MERLIHPLPEDGIELPFPEETLHKILFELAQSVISSERPARLVELIVSEQRQGTLQTDYNPGSDNKGTAGIIFEVYLESPQQPDTVVYFLFPCDTTTVTHLTHPRKPVRRRKEQLEPEPEETAWLAGASN